MIPMRTLHLRYLAFVVGFSLFVAGMAMLERAGLSTRWIGTLFMVLSVFAYAIIGFFCRTTNDTDFFLAGRRVPAFYNGAATAADWMSAASFIGTAGFLYLQGFAGVSYILGWTGGYCLLGFLLVPYLRRFGHYSLPDFLGARYGGHTVRALGAAAVMLVSFIYLVVQIYGVGLIASHLVGVGFEVGILIGLGGVLVCSFLGGMRAITWTQVAQYVVLIVAYLVPVVWISVKQTGSPVPLHAVGSYLENIAQREAFFSADAAEGEVSAVLRLRARDAEGHLRDVGRAIAAEREMLESRLAQAQREGASIETQRAIRRELADLPRSEFRAVERYQRDIAAAPTAEQRLTGVAPQTLPYPQGDPDGSPASQERFSASRLNFIALMFCLMIGTPAMPHVLMRFQTTPTVREARRSVVWALFFICVLYAAAPVLAVMVKYEVFNSVIGTPIRDLPKWLSRWASIDPGLVSVRDINGDGILQLGELKLAGDVIVLAAPEIGGLPYVVTALVAVGGLAAALSTADGLLMTIASAIGHDFYYRIFRPELTSVRRVLIAKVLVMAIAVLAAAIATLKTQNILVFVSLAFSLAGSAFFPALVFGIFWRRANKAGAIAGMVVGLSVSLYYAATNLPWLRGLFGVLRPLEETRWWGIDPIAAGIFGVPAGALTLVLVSWLTAPPGPAEQALVSRLRLPQAPGR